MKMENDQDKLVPNFDFESQLETDLDFGLELPVMDFEASTLTEL